MSTTGDESQTVRRRAVFFISGFDPKGAAYYHRMYRTEAPRQGSTNGWFYEVGSRQKRADHVQGWTVKASHPAQYPGQTQVVSADIEFLVWDDIVRSQWPKGWWGVLVGSVLAYWSAISSGPALVRVWAQSRRTLLALAYPAIFWLFASLLAIGGGIGLGQVLGWAPGGVLAAGIVASAFRIEKKLHTSWLLRIYRFADRWARGSLPALDQRLDDMSRRVGHRLVHGDDHGLLDDEVLVVGYSVGSMLAADVLARVGKLCEGAPGAVDRLSVLTLAQCIPLLGLMPAAGSYRQALVDARAAKATWVDVSAPSDWGSFALIDPFAMCLEAHNPNVARKQAFVSPRFHTLFGARDYQALKSDKRGLHLQYLKATPLPGGYDYFQITAGPRSLWHSVNRWNSLS